MKGFGRRGNLENKIFGQDGFEINLLAKKKLQLRLIFILPTTIEDITVIS